MKKYDWGNRWMWGLSIERDRRNVGVDERRSDPLVALMISLHDSHEV